MDIITAFHHTPISVLIRHPLVSAPPETPLREAVRIFRERNVSTLIIVDGGKIAGVVTERDLVEKAFRESTLSDTPISALMTSPPVTLTPQAVMADVLRLLDHERFRHVPIVNAEGRPLGVVSVRDVLEYLAESLPEEVLNLPPRPTRPQPSAEGA